MHEQAYDRAIKTLNELLDRVGDDENHPLYALLDTLGTLVETYEESAYPAPVPDGTNVLRFLMDEHELTAADLPELGDAQQVEDLLAGRRELSIDNVKQLAKRFDVSPTTFL